MADARTGYPNLGAPSRSVAPRGVPWCSADPICFFGGFAFHRLSQMGVGKGALDTGNIREFGRNAPKYGGFQCAIVKFRRSAAFRSFPWRAAVSLCLFCSFEFPLLPRLGVGGWLFGAKMPKYGGLPREISNFRRPVTFRWDPWRSEMPLCLRGSVVLTRPSQLGVWKRGRRTPEILANLGRIRQNTADSRDGWPNLGVP